MDNTISILNFLFGGIGITIFGVGFYYIKRYFSKLNRLANKLRRFCNLYECFHLSSSGKPIIVRSIGEISLDGWGNKAKVDFKSSKFKYKGNILLQDGNLYLTLQDDNKRENISIILKEPLSLKFDILMGVFVAVTEERFPVAGKFIWHKITDSLDPKDLRLTAVDKGIRKYLETPGNPIKFPETGRESLLSELNE